MPLYPPAGGGGGGGGSVSPAGSFPASAARVPVIAVDGSGNAVVSDEAIAIAEAAVAGLPADLAARFQTATALGGDLAGTLPSPTVAHVDGAAVTTGTIPAGALGNAIPKSIGSAKGSLPGYSAANTPAEVVVGADGTTFVADSSQPTGVKWIANVLNRIGSFIFAGHSWLVFGGSGGDEQGRRAEGLAGRFASMENISTTEVISLGRSGAQMFDDSLFPRIGWTGIAQLLVPPSNLRRGIDATAPSAPYASQPGGLFFLYGINDILVDLFGLAATRGLYRAYGNALRHAIVCGRSGGDFDESHASVAYTGFATQVTTAAAQGVGYKKTATNADKFTITLPADFPGGTVAVRMIGTNDISTALAAAVDNVQTKFAFSAFGFGTVPSSFPCLALCGTEQVSITAANGTGTQVAAITGTTHGTTTIDGISPALTAADVGKMVYGNADIPNGATIVSQTGAACVISAAATGSHVGISLTVAICHTVTRGVNGSAAASHAVSAIVNSAAGAKVQWSGTAAIGVPADTPIAAQGLCSQQTPLVPQSAGTIPVVQRFKGLTAADAGKTIIGTVAGIPATPGEQFVGFDCYSIEAPTTKPIVIINAANYIYAGIWAIVTPAQTALLNALMASVVAEFDSTVVIADVATLFATYGATLGAPMNATDVTTTVAMTAGTKGPNPGEFIRWAGGEECFITAVAGGNFTMTRGANGTTKTTHATNDIAYNRSLFSSDNVHPSTYGYRVLAGLLKTTFGSMNLSTDQLNEANGYYRVEPLTLRHLSYMTGR